MTHLTLPQRLTWWRDLLLSFTNLFLGNLLPKLTPSAADLTGKTAIVTGANSGIGLQMATEFTAMGATVYLACRSESRANAAVQGILARYPDAKDRVHVLLLDTSSLASVQAFAERWKADGNRGRRIDILCHNAGAGQPPGPDELFTAEDLEFLYVTNFLASFLLTCLLERELAEDARVVFTSSLGTYITRFAEGFEVQGAPVRNRVEPGFHCPVFWLGRTVVMDDDNSRYNCAKAMQAAFAMGLQGYFDRRMVISGATTRPTAHSFSPGFTMTPIFGKLKGLSWWRDPVYSGIMAGLVCAVPVSQGAATGVWLATTQDDSVVGMGKAGGYWERMTRRMGTGDVVGQEMLDRLWARWEKDAGVEWRV